MLGFNRCTYPMPRCLSALFFFLALASIIYLEKSSSRSIDIVDRVLNISYQEESSLPSQNLLTDELNGNEVYQSNFRRHKNLFPLNGWDKAGIFAAVIGLMIAAGGGIGGGGVLVPIFVLLLRFQPKYAIPLSNITIFGGSITNVFLNMNKRHPSSNRPLVDWDLMLVMEPLTIAGALIGSFINKVLPEGILALSLVILLSYTAHRTLKKGISAYTKESKAFAKKAESIKMSELSSLHAAEMEELGEEEGISLLGRNTDDFSKPFSTTAFNGSNSDEAEFEMDSSTLENKLILERIYEEERNTPKMKVFGLSCIFVVVLAVNLMKGGGSFKSPVGITCGSVAFWGATLFMVAWIVIVSLKIRNMLIERWYLKTKCGYRYVEGDVQWTPTATVKYPCLCFFAGFFAGLFGVGGGIIKGPLMLEMNVDPQVASATSACMILYTSFTATTSFIVFGLLRKDYAIMLFIVGLVSTFAGQVGVNYLIQRFQRSSFIILSIGAVVALSAVLMGGQSLYFFAFPRPDGAGHEGFCSAGE